MFSCSELEPIISVSSWATFLSDTTVPIYVTQIQTLHIALIFCRLQRENVMYLTRSL